MCYKGKKDSMLITLFLLFIFYLYDRQLSNLDPGQSVDQFLLEQWENKEGLASNNIHSITQKPDRYLWFFTFSGLVRYGSIWVGLKEGMNRLDNGIKNIGFHFASPTFSSPPKIMVKYKLEGYDKKWTFLPPGEKRMNLYNDLAPGTYTFRVTACNSEGIWNDTETVMIFTLKSRFPKTISFKLLILLGCLALISGAVFLYKRHPLVKNGNEKVKYNNSHLNPVYVKECIKNLDYLMQVEKVYRDEHISLQSLSRKLSVTPHQLSRILNEKVKKNFPDFVNTYRVEEAKKLLREPGRSSRKILTIAFDVGFNTKVAFNIAFKKYTKMTPTEFRKIGSK